MIGLKQGSGGGGTKVYIDNVEQDYKEMYMSSGQYAVVSIPDMPAFPTKYSAAAYNGEPYYNPSGATVYKFNGTSYTSVSVLPNANGLICDCQGRLFCIYCLSNKTYVYEYNGASWVQKASGTNSGNDFTFGAACNLGTEILLVSNGSTINYNVESNTVLTWAVSDSPLSPMVAYNGNGYYIDAYDRGTLIDFYLKRVNRTGSSAYVFRLPISSTISSKGKGVLWFNGDIAYISAQDGAFFYEATTPENLSSQIDAPFILTETPSRTAVANVDGAVYIFGVNGSSGEHAVKIIPTHQIKQVQ